MGFSILLLSDFLEVLEEFALGYCVNDTDNCGILADRGYSVVAGETHFLNVLTLVFVNLIELCHIDFSTAYVREKLFPSSFVCIINLQVNLLFSRVADSTESLLLNSVIVKLEASIAALNTLNKLSKPKTG